MQWDRIHMVVGVLVVLNLVGIVLGVHSALIPPPQAPMVLDSALVRPMTDTATSRPVYLVEKPPLPIATGTDYSPLVLPCLANMALAILCVWPSFGKHDTVQTQA